jgi:hypothetical protein
MVLQILPHPRQIVKHGNPVLCQQRRRTDARQLQQLRRADGASRQDEFALDLKV